VGKFRAKVGIPLIKIYCLHEAYCLLKARSCDPIASESLGKYKDRMQLLLKKDFKEIFFKDQERRTGWIFGGGYAA
jgi:hypothetical protein